MIFSKLNMIGVYEFEVRLNLLKLKIDLKQK